MYNWLGHVGATFERPDTTRPATVCGTCSEDKNDEDTKTSVHTHIPSHETLAPRTLVHDDGDPNRIGERTRWNQINLALHSRFEHDASVAPLLICRYDSRP